MQPHSAISYRITYTHEYVNKKFNKSGFIFTYQLLASTVP